MWAREKEEKETIQDELSDAQVSIKGYEADIKDKDAQIEIE